MVNFPVQRKEVATFEKLKTETIHLSTRQSLDGEAYEEHPTSPVTGHRTQNRRALMRVHFIPRRANVRDEKLI